MKPEKICNLHRSLLLVTGERSRVSDVIRNALHDIESDSLLVSDDVVAYQGMTLVTYKQAKGLLGQEKRVVVFDVYDDIHPDALAAVTGLIVGGGCLILCLPPAAEWKSVFLSEFSKRFIHFLYEAQFAKRIDAKNEASIQQIKNSLKDTLK
ncbi:MAG: DUF1726 domain-containing protein, partial [Gammaproteobacteria bacterium]|nr:DUF1726 domain-containing protein [Gammaproteobacteria bacterium]